MPTFPLTLPAIKVTQPLGEFFVVALDATTLLQVTFLDPTRIEKVDTKAFWYSLLGAQRQSSPRRAKQIGKYIDTEEAAFPNSIILAANYINDGELQEDETKRWRVESVNDSLFQLVIPSDSKMASIVDGQHRLLGFDYCDPKRKTMELLCAVYIDLPHSYQAYLFATININQRKVDKSLAYDQFGYNLDDEDRDGWSPDKLAVAFTRKFNLDPESPFHRRIKVAPMNAELLFPTGELPDWQVSTACMVEGIAKLISQNPKADRDLLHKTAVGSRSRSSLPKDSSPLRELYLGNQDDEISRLITIFFETVRKHLWNNASPRAYIRKTIGIQALFDVFVVSVEKFGVKEAEKQFDSILAACSQVDFSDSFYQASGRGRVRVKNTILLYASMLLLDHLPESEQHLYRELFKKYPRQVPPKQVSDLSKH
ncbi:MAG: DGQHR domain-containing protein [Deltaproteobacteria bacterium]|nr:DGQHR domain-containing protein [Deltaproteobacteria bacterium]